MRRLCSQPHHLLSSSSHHVAVVVGVGVAVVVVLVDALLLPVIFAVGHDMASRLCVVPLSISYSIGDHQTSWIIPTAKTVVITKYGVVHGSFAALLLLLLHQSADSTTDMGGSSQLRGMDV